MITSSLGRMVVFDNFKNRVSKDAPVLDVGRGLSKGAIDTFLNGHGEDEEAESLETSVLSQRCLDNEELLDICPKI